MDISGGTWAAVVFAVLMTTSMVAMPALTGTGQSATLADVDDASAASTTLADAEDAVAATTTNTDDSDVVRDPRSVRANSSVDALETALAELETLDFEEGAARTAAADAADAIADARATYRQPNAVDAASGLDRLVDAQAHLETLASAVEDDRQHRIERVSALVHDASTATARLAVIDADRTHSSAAEDLEAAGTHDETAAALEDAEASLQAADDAEQSATALAVDAEAPLVVERDDPTQLDVTITNVGAVTDPPPPEVSSKTTTGRR